MIAWRRDHVDRAVWVALIDQEVRKVRSVSDLGHEIAARPLPSRGTVIVMRSRTGEAFGWLADRHGTPTDGAIIELSFPRIDRASGPATGTLLVLRPTGLLG